MRAAGLFQGFELRPVKLPANVPYRPVGLALGRGSSALEVVVAESDAEPRLPQVRSAWKARQGGRAAPLVLVVFHDGRATICGPVGDDPPAYPQVDPGQAERICREALEQPDRHAALRYLRDALPAVESKLPGIRNEGFLATHELERGVRVSHAWSKTWTEAEQKARPLLGRRDQELLRSLGFGIEPCDQVTSILRAGENGKRTAVAVLLQQSESPELQASRFGNLSPVSYALAVADRESLPYVVVLQGSKLRLYPVKVGVGVGRRGRTETYVEIHTGLLRDTDAGYLWLLFSAEALVEGGTLERLLDDSKRFAGGLAERLRERIYGEVIPRLAEGLAAARGLKKPTAKDLAETYEMAMTVLFRLLFIAYAEDKDLLPYKHNESYRDRSLKRKATELLRLHHEGTPFDDSDSLWKEVTLLCEAVRAGKPEWGVPEYDGGLFENNPDVSPVGAMLEKVRLSNKVFGPALRDLLIIQTPEGWGPVDFRSLGVREFGTVYEGLLESELSIAETDLTVDKDGYYRPARRGEEAVVKQQRIYLHDRSGARKSTGTYFTKEFAVEHLLTNALDPAIKDHLERLDKLDDDEAAERFFDFRVADIAMGSGHFLVAAVDHVEQAMTQYLARRPLSGVRTELAKLRASATDALGNLADQVEIEDTQLLRRLIARRCIYGVDLNPVSVHLARLSIWIHTFVPGLPLSLLDHNLVVGNSLVGVARVEEIVELAGAEGLDPKNVRQMMMYGMDAESLVGAALEPLRKLAQITDLTAAEIKKARKAMEQAREKTKPAEALCDIVTACRMNRENLPVDLQEWERVKSSIVDSRHHKAACRTIADLTPLHFPVAFPEVFLRDRSGFDVIVGNPPWQEATLEEHAFWARHFPGLRGLTQREQEREKQRLRKEWPDLVNLYEEELAEAKAMRGALVSGPYPGMGTGDPDLYKAFCWRFFHLIAADGGRIGVVLPRSAFSAKGTTAFRQTLFEYAEPVDITTLVNNRQWVFPEVHPQYSIGLVAIRRIVAGASSPCLLRQDVQATRGTAYQPVSEHGQDARATYEFHPFNPRELSIRYGAYLPHWEQEGATYSVTFRLGDSLPREVLEGWARERVEIMRCAQAAQRPLSEAERRRLHELHSDRVEKYLNAGHGACLLKDERGARIVRDALLHFDGDRYDLLVWCVMPNHVHVVVHPKSGQELSKILHSWKSFTSNQVNKVLGRSGPLWEPESFDHLIRDADGLERSIQYVLQNPRVAGLGNWPWVGCGTAFQAMNEHVHRHGQDARATTTAAKTIRLRGPFNSLERFTVGVQRPPAVFDTSDVMSWTDTASLPLLPTEESLEVFTRLRQAPRLDAWHGHPAHDFAHDPAHDPSRAGSPCHWRARPHTELHATNDKKLMDLESHERPRGFWPVYKGESFDIWDPDRGEYYAWADPKIVVNHLADKRYRGRNRRNSVWYEFRERPLAWWKDEKTLPCFAPRIAFRDVTRATDLRTVRVALVPPKVLVNHKAPYFLWPRGDQKDEAFLLGVLASLPLDWYARRFVEVSMTFFILNPFPIPRPRREDPLWQRAVSLAGRLAAVDDRYADWARAVGAGVARASSPCSHGQDAHATSTVTSSERWRLGECRPLDPDLKYDMMSELDAVVAHLYGLDEKHLVHIFETFHEGWEPGKPATHPTLGDYDLRIKTTLKHYRRLAEEVFPTVYQRLKPVIGKPLTSDVKGKAEKAV